MNNNTKNHRNRRGTPNPPSCSARSRDNPTSRRELKQRGEMKSVVATGSKKALVGNLGIKEGFKVAVIDPPENITCAC
jgi:hypothetical protein